MSAFICDEKHILALAVYLSQNEHNGIDDRTNAYANTLYRENIKSVQHRYPDDKWDDLPGPCEKSIALRWEDGISFREWVTDPVWILSMVKCLEYQSCEHPEWQTSDAKNLCERIQNIAISKLPGYEDAPWEYRGKTEAA